MALRLRRGFGRGFGRGDPRGFGPVASVAAAGRGGGGAGGGAVATGCFGDGLEVVGLVDSGAGGASAGNRRSSVHTPRSGAASASAVATIGALGLGLTDVRGIALPGKPTEQTALPRSDSGSRVYPLPAAFPSLLACARRGYQALG